MLSARTSTRTFGRAVRLFSKFDCWKCQKGNEPPSLECGSCGNLLQPDKSVRLQNFFALFGV
mgnify:FL=1